MRRPRVREGASNAIKELQPNAPLLSTKLNCGSADCDPFEKERAGVPH